MMSQREQAARPDPPQLETRGSTQCTLGPLASWETQPVTRHHFQLKLTEEEKRVKKEKKKRRAAPTTEISSSSSPKFEIWFYLHRDSARRSHHDHHRTKSAEAKTHLRTCARRSALEVDPYLPHRRDDRRSRRLSLISTLTGRRGGGHVVLMSLVTFVWLFYLLITFI